jgi:hypothetical protein
MEASALARAPFLLGSDEAAVIRHDWRTRSQLLALYPQGIGAIAGNAHPMGRGRTYAGQMAWDGTRHARAEWN